MTEEQLLAKVLEPEGLFLERKPSLSDTKAIKRTLVAFANSVPEGQAAVLIVGISDSGEILGIEDPDSAQKTLVRLATQSCFPPVNCFPAPLLRDGKHLVAVVVPFSKNRPHFTGHAFVRKGSQNSECSADEFEKLIVSRNDKARRILSELGKIVTVVERTRYRITFPGKFFSSSEGPHERSTDTTTRKHCRIESCDSFVVTYRDVADDELSSAPLSKVTIDFDPTNTRTQFVIDYRS